MKNYLLSILIFITFGVFGQNRFAVIAPIKIYPTDTFYAGDSIIMDFKWKKPTVTPIVDSSRLYFTSFKNSILIPIWEDKWQALKDFPVVDRIGADSIQRIRLKLPNNIDTGNAFFVVTFTNYPIYIKSRVATAIKTYTKESKIIATRYFDILGNELSVPKSNMIIIKVDTYEDGSFTSKRTYQY